jgi:predicted protein tyrosine phosphatase
VSSAGLDPVAARVLDKATVAAADAIFVMERYHRDKIRKRSRAVLGQWSVFVLAFPMNTSATSRNWPRVPP